MAVLARWLRNAVLRTAAWAGCYDIMTQLFEPQVRGGEGAALVQVGIDPIECQADRFDAFIALDREKLEQVTPEIPLDKVSIIVADPAPANATIQHHC